MTAAVHMLDELRRSGLALWADGDRLLYRPRALLDRDPDLRARVRAAKPELLRLLSVPDPTRTELPGLAVAEVLGFPAALLGELPLATSLVIETPTGRRTLDTRTEPWRGMVGPDRARPVRDVLAAIGATLRAVVIEGA